MAARRSVRRFAPTLPPRALIQRLIDAAVTAPSASNKQPWRFVVVTDPAVIGAMGQAVRRATDALAAHVPDASEASFRAYGTYFTRFEDAPAVIVALHRPVTILGNLLDAKLPAEARECVRRMEQESGLIGTAMALQNLLLMAPALGLGASGMTGPLVARPAIRQLLRVRDSWAIAALVVVGYPEETPPPTARKDSARVTRWMEASSTS